MPSPVRFAEIAKLLESKGYALESIRGSHHKFKKTGQPIVVIPVHHGKAKHVYWKIAQEAR